MVIDYFDKSVKTVDALKVLGIQVLAVIPKISDLQENEKMRRKNLRFYLVAGGYFSMIVALLALEALGRSPIELFIRIVNQ